MAEPCCPDHAGGRGAPYTAHWFVIHDGSGAPDTWATWRFGGLPRTDLECATSVKGMSERAGSPFLYGEQTRKWYVWDGSGRFASQEAVFDSRMTQQLAGWLRTAMDDVQQAVQEQVDALPPDRRPRAQKAAEDAWKPHKAFVSRIWNHQGQVALQGQLAESHAIDVTRLDAGTGRIVVDNGVLDIGQIVRDGTVRLLPHDPGALVTHRMGAGVRWEPDARCPAFDRYIAESVADADQRWWLCWRTCCALFGRMARKGFVNVIGESDSGKSTFTEAIAWLAGEYARAVPVETFLAKRGGDQGFAAHELMAARFVYTHEPNASALYDVSFMKSLTGRDRMRTRTLYEKPVEWVPQCTPFIGSNNPIRFSTADDAMMKREEVIRFARNYDQADPWLIERLRAEKNGILRMLIGHALDEHRIGHVPDLPLSVVIERERMAVETEDALEFVAEWMREGRLREDSEAPAYRCAQIGPLYQHYRYWCDEAGVRPCGRKTFAAVLGRKYRRTNSGGRYHFTGLITVDA